MEYREIVAVTGLSGLYQLVTTKSDGAIVRNVADKTTKFISARQHNVTPLESIEVYTTGENVRLHHVFMKMQEHDTSIPTTEVKVADNGAIKKYFKSIFPEFDEDRVYVSDMKKMLKWYELLKENDLLHFEEEKEEGASDESSAEAHEEAGQAEKKAVAQESVENEEKPAAKKAKVKKAADTEEAPDAEEQPKKQAKKKKEDQDESAEDAEKPAKKTAKKKKTEE